MRVLRVRSEYSLPLTVTQTDNTVDPRGERAVLFSVPVGCWGTPVGPTPSPRPAVHSGGMTALHYAALYGNRRMIRSLVDANAAVNAKTCLGCAVSAAANRPLSAPAESPPPSAVQEHAAACCRDQRPSRIRRGAAAARRRRGRRGQRRVPLRCAAQPKPKRQQPRA